MNRKEAKDIIKQVPLYRYELERNGQSDLFQALDIAISDMQKMEKIESALNYIDIAIRCAMCTNTMANDKGCDGGCRVDKIMYKRVLNVIDNEIGKIVKKVE